jgi:putative tricarboxylic transport membrane protein
VSDPALASGRERRTNHAALVVGGLLVAAAAAVAYDAALIRPGVATYSRIGPRVFPYAIAAALLAIGIATAISALRNRAAETPSIAPAPVLWILGGLAGQIALLGTAGFSLATGVVFSATAAALGRTRVWVTYPIGVAFSLAIWLVFAIGLKLALPAGPLEVIARSEATAIVAAVANDVARLIESVRGATLAR